MITRVKDSSDHFIFEINAGKGHSKLIEDDVIQIQSRSILDPPLSDMDFENKIAWVRTTVNSWILRVHPEYDFENSSRK